MVSQNGARSLQDFWAVTADDISNTAPVNAKGATTYHVRVREAKVDEWDDGRARLDISTEVVSGEHTGKYGPRITLSEPHDYEGVTKDGRAWKTTVRQEEDKISVQLNAMMGGMAFEFSLPIDEAAFAIMAKQLNNKEFITNVKLDDNGYLRATRVFAMSNPPPSFKDSKPIFNLDVV